MSDASPAVKVVTPRQYASGYSFYRNGTRVDGLRFTLIRELEDGNFLVRDPESEVVSSGDQHRLPSGISWEGPPV